MSQKIKHFCEGYLELSSVPADFRKRGRFQRTFPRPAARTCVGEVVFNTGMTGYPESLTDPSYAGQISFLHTH